MSDAVIPTSMDAFAEQVGTTRVHLFYKLPPEMQPRTVRIGRLRKPVETTVEYLKRIEAMQTAQREPAAA